MSWKNGVLVGDINELILASLGAVGTGWRSKSRLRRKGLGKREHAWEETREGVASDEEELLT